MTQQRSDISLRWRCPSAQHGSGKLLCSLSRLKQSAWCIVQVVPTQHARLWCSGVPSHLWSQIAPSSLLHCSAGGTKICSLHPSAASCCAVPCCCNRTCCKSRTLWARFIWLWGCNWHATTAAPPRGWLLIYKPQLVAQRPAVKHRRAASFSWATCRLF